MSSSSQVRWGELGALLAAAGWTVSGIIAFAFGVAPFGPVGSLSWYLIESSDAIAEAGMLVALVGLHVRQVPNYGRLGTTGLVVAFVGTASIFLATVIWLLTAYPVGEGAILDILEYVSLFGLLVGFPLLGVATFRARVLPRWCGVLLVALPAVFLLVFSLVEYSVTTAEAAKDQAEADLKKLSDFLNPTSVADRRLFYEKVKGRRLPSGWQDCTDAPQPDSTWIYGFSAYPDSDAVVIHQTDYEHYLKKDGDPGRSSDGYYVHEFRFSNPNALIVGVEIVSDWGRDHNGSWRAGSQFLLQKGGNVTVSSEYSRGTNWRCRWFYTDAKDYQQFA